MDSSALVITSKLSEIDLASVEALRDLKAKKIRREALSEQATDHLGSDGSADHYLVTLGGNVVVYAQGTENPKSYDIEFLADEIDDDVLHAAAGRGVALSKPVALWIHGLCPGDPPPEINGRLDRTVLRLQRPLLSDGHHETPTDVTVRTFDPMLDAAAWLNVNRRAFLAHPEQGSVDAAGLERKLEQSWFNPDGFFLAERDKRLAGFSWTKIHAEPWGSVGEIYVIGVDPSMEGRGIAHHLLDVSFEWLANQGLETVMLYCELDNRSALGLYEKLGFVEEWRDERWVLNAYPEGLPMR